MKNPIKLHYLADGTREALEYSANDVATCIEFLASAKTKNEDMAYIIEFDDKTYEAHGSLTLITEFQTTHHIDDKSIEKFNTYETPNFIKVSEEKAPNGQKTVSVEYNGRDNPAIVKNAGAVTLGDNAKDMAILNAESLNKSLGSNSSLSAVEVGKPSPNFQITILGSKSANARDNGAAVAVAHGPVTVGGAQQLSIGPNTNGSSQAAIQQQLQQAPRAAVAAAQAQPATANNEQKAAVIQTINHPDADKLSQFYMIVITKEKNTLKFTTLFNQQYFDRAKQQAEQENIIIQQNIGLALDSCKDATEKFNWKSGNSAVLLVDLTDKVSPLHLGSKSLAKDFFKLIEEKTINQINLADHATFQDITNVLQWNKIYKDHKPAKLHQAEVLSVLEEGSKKKFTDLSSFNETALRNFKCTVENGPEINLGNPIVAQISGPKRAAATGNQIQIGCLVNRR